MATTPRTTTSRKPRTAARAASRPATTRPAADEEFDEPETSAAEAQEIEGEGHYVTATLGEDEVRIVPPGAWRQSWQRLLNQGQTDAWAEQVFHPDDYELYLDLDPTNQEIWDLVRDAAQQAGESLGKSRGPAPSSRRTRRR
ncbi:hypothetical protein AB0D42_18560 [Streptomyces sp. NPDC048304]|uniref:hypothetical protein n=1 Tax=Streptomyces sp. NPDC048304 TaxID=3154820 RepID=UPI0033D9B06E